MSVADLVFVLAVLVTAVTVLRVAYLLVRARWSTARRTAIQLGAGVAVYAAVLIVVSVFSSQRVMGLHQERCFDDWCLAVERVDHPRSIGAVTPQGQFYVVTVQVSSLALRASQRALDAQVYLVDRQGRRYNPSSKAQRILDRSGAGGQPLNSELPASGSFTRTIAFDLALDARRVGLVVTHGLFPDVLVIGDAQSLLHKPTIILL